MYQSILSAFFSILLLQPLILNAQSNTKTDYSQERIALLNMSGRVDGWIKETITNQIESELSMLKRFQVINRRAIESASKELRLNLSGLVDESSMLRVGKFLSAKKIIVGNVNYSNSTYNRENKLHTTELSLTATIIEVERSLTQEGINITVSGSSDTRAKSIQTAINQAVYQFMIRIREIYSLNAVVISKEGSSVLINMGNFDGLKPGIIFDVMDIGDRIIDPFSGEVYGQRETLVGRIKVTEVFPKYSKAKIIEGIYKIRPGNRIKERPGLLLSSGYFLFSYSLIPVNSYRNSSFITSPINQAQYFGLSYIWENVDSNLPVEVQVGYVALGSINSFAGDIIAKYKISFIPEFINIYPGVGIGFVWASQGLPNAGQVIQELNLNSDDTSVNDAAFGYLASVALRLVGMRYFQPFAEIGWRSYNKIDEWSIQHKTGEKKDGKDVTKSVEIPDSYLPYPSLKVGGLSFRFGLILNF